MFYIQNRATLALAVFDHKHAHVGWEKEAEYATGYPSRVWAEYVNAFNHNLGTVVECFEGVIAVEPDGSRTVVNLLELVSGAVL